MTDNNDENDENGEKFHEFSGETEDIALITRKCDSCGGEAVSLGGAGADCEDPACMGVYAAKTGFQVFNVYAEQAEMYREQYPEAVAE